MKKIKIKVFAVLKDYMEPEFELEGDFVRIEDVREELQKQFSPATKVLRLSRFAVDNAFVDSTYLLKDNDYIYIMPPSSGG